MSSRSTIIKSTLFLAVLGVAATVYFARNNLGQSSLSSQSSAIFIDKRHRIQLHQKMRPGIDVEIKLVEELSSNSVRVNAIIHANVSAQELNFHWILPAGASLLSGQSDVHFASLRKGESQIISADVQFDAASVEPIHAMVQAGFGKHRLSQTAQFFPSIHKELDESRENLSKRNLEYIDSH